MTDTAPYFVGCRIVRNKSDDRARNGHVVSLVKRFARSTSLAIATLLFLLSASHAQQPGQGASAQPPPAEVQQLLELLGKPQVRNWLETEAAKKLPIAQALRTEPKLAHWLADRLGQIRSHIAKMVGVAGKMPQELRLAIGRFSRVISDMGWARVLFDLIVVFGLGFAAMWAVRSIAGDIHRPGDPQVTPIQRRVRLLMSRLALGWGEILAFALGSFTSMLFFNWLEPLRTITVHFVVALALAMLAKQMLAALLTPFRTEESAPHSSFVTAAPATAAHLRSRLIFASVWLAFSYAFVNSLILLDGDRDVALLCSYILGFALLVILIEAVWRRPARTQFSGRFGWYLSWLVSAYLVVLWAVWIAGVVPLFWFLVVMLALPVAARITRLVIRGLILPQEQVADTGFPLPALAAAVERSARIVLIITAILMLAWAWDVRFERLSDFSDPLAWLARSVLVVLAIFLTADLIWQVTRTLIDVMVDRSASKSTPGSREADHHAKVRTLLPILRNVVLIFLATLAILMSLSSLGIAIGPLIASAGIIGVAIGFGAQTLVKDVISGIFYLLDDAFRVGEYIISNQYAGIVESFSIRSLRLRHFLGPVYTIPFSELGSIQNMSRDYAIDNLTITVTYDADIEKARELTNEIGEELSNNPDYADSIIKPLEMKGISEFGESGINLRMSVTTKPGAQFALRREAYTLIKQKFDANGIEFAYPTVRIAGGAGGDTGAARHVLAKGAKSSRRGGGHS